MKRWIIPTLAGVLLAGFALADPPTVWKDYDSAFLGVHLQVMRDWQAISIKETPETGTIAFNLSPHTTISIVRQSWDQSFDVWTSSEILTQIFKPGYKIVHTEFAGRKSVEVSGEALDGRTQESYYSGPPRFIDEITFTAPPDEWTAYHDALETVKKSVHWTR